MGLAALGARKLGDEVESIEDGAELAQVRRQAQGVQIKSVVTAAVLTVGALLL